MNALPPDANIVHVTGATTVTEEETVEAHLRALTLMNQAVQLLLEARLEILRYGPGDGWPVLAARIDRLAHHVALLVEGQRREHEKYLQRQQEPT